MPRRLLRWLALGLGTLASVFFLAFAFGEGVAELFRGSTAALYPVVTIIVASLGVALAYWKPVLGGVIAIVGGIAAGLGPAVGGSLNDFRVAAMLSGPYVLCGAMVLFAELGLSRSEGKGILT